MSEPITDSPEGQGRRLDRRNLLYLRLGRRVLPIALLLSLLAYALINTLYLVSSLVSEMLTLILQGPIPARLREFLTFVRYYGLPVILILLILWTAASPSRKGWLLALERVCGKYFIRLADLFSRFGEHLFHKHRFSKVLLWLSAAAMVASLVKAYDRHEADKHIIELKSALNDAMIKVVCDTPVLHCRNLQAFESVKAAEAAIETDPTAAKKTNRHPAACLYALLNNISEANSADWPQVSKQLADLDEAIPPRLSRYCLKWRVYHDKAAYADPGYVDALAGLSLALAKLNDRRSLEGSLHRETMKAATFFLQARKLYDETNLPVNLPVREWIALAAANGLGNYFSACFSHWPDLGCDQQRQTTKELVCNNLEECYDNSINYYTRLQSESDPNSAITRRVNNTVDVKMKALIRFASSGPIPVYVQNSLSSDSLRPTTPVSWLESSIAMLQDRTASTLVPPEIYVTLSQLYAVELSNTRTSASKTRPQDRPELTRRSIENLEISQRLSALERDYFLSDVRKRGWCGLLLELEVSSATNEELRRRLLAVIGSLPQDDPEEWFLHACEQCRRRVVDQRAQESGS
jgi:hypothetical protein